MKKYRLYNLSRGFYRGYGDWRSRESPPCSEWGGKKTGKVRGRRCILVDMNDYLEDEGGTFTSGGRKIESVLRDVFQ